MQAGKSASSASPLVTIDMVWKKKLRIMNLPPASIHSMRTTIQASWQWGIRSEGGCHGMAYQWKLRGASWWEGGKKYSKEAVMKCRLIAGVMHFLLQQGWALHLVTTVPVVDTFYFTQCTPELNVRMCAILFYGTDTIQVIDGPKDLTSVVRSCIQNNWAHGFKEGSDFGAVQFIMFGSPWKSSEVKALQTSEFVGQLIQALNRTGWEIYASVNCYISYTDCWILQNKQASSNLHPSMQEMGTSASPLVCVSLHHPMLRVMNLPPALIHSMHTVIPTASCKGNKYIYSDNLFYQWHLKNDVWENYGLVTGCRVITNVTRFMLQQGWAFHLATTINTRYHKDTIYFVQCAPQPNVQMCSIAFTCYLSTIFVVDGPEEVPRAVRSSIQNYWSNGLKQGGSLHGVAFFKLFGHPWQYSQLVATRNLLGHLIQALNCAGWEIFASIRFTNSVSDLDNNDFGHTDIWLLQNKQTSTL